MNAVPALDGPKGTGAYEIEKIRADFPILSCQVHGKPLVYLDNAATSQKPQAVLDALMGFYGGMCSNIHRGVHNLSERATDAYEQARERIAKFLNAPASRQIVFVRGATEGINLVASGLGIGPGDEVVVTAMEHHSNIVPWQMRGATLRVVPINDKGELEIDQIQITERTKLVSVVHVSNALGTINPVQQIVRMAHERNVP
ncbi:MAG: aminotransferase class V-fold PLP-dependent enzyme, partial [Candidatus Xenobia bacterium]